MPQGTDDLNEDSLWDPKRGPLDCDARTALIDQYSSLVKTVSATLYSRRYDDEVEFDEYYQFGMVGLVESVDRYEPGQGALFETFATYRIRGAILNGLEKMTERREQNAYRSRLSKERLESLAENNDNEHEVSLFEEMAEVALGMAICYMLDDTGLVQAPNKIADEQAYQAQELSQLRDRLIKSIDTLPERERLIMHSHYFQHASFTNLAEILGITKGRVSQLHKRALQLIRKHLVENQSLDGYF